MKKVAVVGLGWLGMPLAMSLTARGWQVTGSKTTQDGVEAARMSGIEGYPLRLEPELVCETDDLDALMDVDALVITLPARRSGPGEDFYLQAMQELVDSALAYRIPRIIFTSSTSVYGDVQGTVKEGTARNPVTASGRVLKELEDWLHNLPGTSVDILRLAAHRRSIDIQAAQDICRSGDANRATGQFKMVVTAVNLDAETAFQLFDVVVKRAAKAQQAGVVCGLKGNFASVCVQTVPLMHREPEGEHSPACQEIIHATGERRKHWNKDGGAERKYKSLIGPMKRRAL